ncbi:MAG: nucleotide exchange factor GrpE [Chloroflexi bacterium]|nr:nucleotide exchange factor GrpE [Chloroflexota bacterium]
MPEEQIKEAEEMQETPVTAATDGDDPAALKQQLELERAKSAEYLDSWRRAAADLSNYRKRAEKETGELAKFANSALIARLLPVLDDFDRAFVTVPDGLRELTWVDGVMLIARKMRAILEAEGLKPIEALGKPFDPNFHEAVIHEETDKSEEGLVTGELQKGYLLNDRVLRPTMVKVAKKKS